MGSIQSGIAKPLLTFEVEIEIEIEASECPPCEFETASRIIPCGHGIAPMPSPAYARTFDFNFSCNFNLNRAMARFDPEKMAAYRLARRHSRAVRALIETADVRGYADLVGQLRRSTASNPANLLEAAGEWRPGKRLNYLMIAKGSPWECWALVDAMVDFGLVPDTALAEVRAAQSEITALLIATIRNLESELAPPIPSI